MANSRKLLRAADMAALVGISPGDFRSRVQRGKAPKPDVPGDPDLPPQRRNPGWYVETGDAWQAHILEYRHRRSEADSESHGAQDLTDESAGA